MQKVLVVSLVAGALALGLLVPRGSSAPALGDKPPHFQFAELRYFSPMPVPAGMAVPGRLGAPGVPPQAAAAVPPGGPHVQAKWSTVTEETEGASWEDLANKLKAPAGKAEGSVTVHKLRVLNWLSAQGWEMLDHQVPDVTNTVWAFRRRVP